MAFIDKAENTRLPVFFNVCKGVGKQAPNAPGDLKLVQYLLMAFYDRLVR